MSPSRTDFDERIGEAVQTVVNETGDEDGARGVVTRWVTVAEVMEPDGEMNLTVFRGPSLQANPIWVVRGMLKEIADDPDLFQSKED